ncbi:MAG: hypothetical protein LQ351_002014 [Letrouitia transgressa]|nr:MAG: hypothetical protein LQ351_002014 [Letrouitia transgressa]
MDTLEAQRQLNIKRNQEHLRELGIYRNSSKAPVVKKNRAKAVRVALPQQQQRKPLRSSARIASSTSNPRSYNEDKDDLQTGNLPKRRRKLSEPSSSSSKPKQPQTDGSSPSPPAADLQSLISSWSTWTLTAPPPTRSSDDSTFHFSSHPSFRPNKSPEEILREGAFGGSYFRPLYSAHLRTTVRDDWRELPPQWLAGLDVSAYLTRADYEPELNKFKTACGQSIEEWEAAGWINHAYDVRGWFQWYCRFFMGRRCPDDERQVGRWQRCVGENGRWRRILLKQYVAMGITEVFDDGADDDDDRGGRKSGMSPRVSQTVHQWGFEVRQNILDDFWRTNGK